MNNINFFSKLLLILLLPLHINAYNLPVVNLGGTNFLDGGPLRLLPGWYLGESSKYYYSNRLIDSKGNQLNGVNSPSINVFYINTGIVFQSDRTSIIGAKWGVATALPMAFVIDVGRNSLGIRSAGAGCGDLVCGPFLQWNTLMRKDGEPLFVHRIEFDVSFPTGKTTRNEISPGNGLYFIDPYWAATLYFSRHWAISWRMHYLWSSKDKFKLQPGTAVHANFDMEYEITKNVWFGLAGYWLQQLTHDRLSNIKIPGYERVVGLGPGFLYRFSKKFYVASMLYFETCVRNRPKGSNFEIRMLLNF